MPHRTAVESLRSVGGDLLVQRMIRMFLSISRDSIERLAPAVQHQAFGTIEAAAHRLHASAAQLGLLDLARTGAALEEAAKARAAAPLAGLFDQLNRQYAARETELQAELQQFARVPAVAVVDDNADIRLLLHYVLEPTYEVWEFATGHEALQAWRADPPAVAVVDLSLPDMTGFELVRAIRGDAALSKLPVIALSARAAQEETRAAGFDAELAKPLSDPEDLLRLIDDLVSEARGD